MRKIIETILYILMMLITLSYLLYCLFTYKSDEQICKNNGGIPVYREIEIVRGFPPAKFIEKEYINCK